MQSTLALLLLPIVSVIADNHTADTTTNSTGGLSGGAVAGIVIGVLFGVSAIGGVVAYYLKEGADARRISRRPSQSSIAAGASRFGDNNLPMMAMRVNGDEEL